jgi:hypothetical protein
MSSPWWMSLVFIKYGWDGVISLTAIRSRNDTYCKWAYSQSVTRILSLCLPSGSWTTSVCPTWSASVQNGNITRSSDIWHHQCSPMPSMYVNISCNLWSEFWQLSEGPLLRASQSKLVVVSIKACKVEGALVPTMFSKLW